MDENILEPNFNGLPKPTDWSKVIVPLQQVNEKEFRGATLNELGDEMLKDKTINGQRMKAVPPGALPAGPADREMYMVLESPGRWTFGGTDFDNVEGQIMTLWWNKTTYSVDNIAVLPKSENKIPIWTPQSFDTGKQVIYNNRIYTANSAGISTDVPGTSGRWDTGVSTKFPYEEGTNFKGLALSNKLDKWLIDAFLDFEFQNGFKYSFSVINKSTLKATLYKHVDGLPSTGNITALYEFTFVKIAGSKYYLGESDLTPKSYVIADFEILSGNVTSVYYTDGIGLSPRLFKNGVVNKSDQIFSVFDEVEEDMVVYNQEAELEIYASTTFKGWGQLFGAVKNFDTINWTTRGVGTAPTKIKMRIRLGGKTAVPILEKEIVVAISTTNAQVLSWTFPEIANDSNELVWVEFVAVNGSLSMWGHRNTTERAYYTTVNDSADVTTITSSPSMMNIEFVGLRDNLVIKKESLPKEDPIIVIPEVEVILADKIQAIVGDKLQLFVRGMIKAVNPYNYNVVIICSKGKQFPRYFEVTPASGDVGNHNLKIQVKDNNGNIIASKDCILEIKSSGISPTSSKTVLGIGDSLLSQGAFIIEADRRLTKTGGTPVGKGFANILFKGRKNNGVVGWEGNGGWSWGEYATAGRTSYRFQVTGVINPPSMGSVYTNNGANFTIDEINITGIDGNIRALGGTAPSPSGILTKVSGEGDSIINFSESEFEAANPFWNTSTGELDITAYVNTYLGGSLDVIYIMLSWNLQTAYKTNFDNEITYAKILFDHIHLHYPNCKIKMMGIQLPSLNGGMGINYGATGVYSDAYGMSVTVLNQNKAYQDFANDPVYSSFVEFINVSAQFDSENNMLEADTPVNSRNTKLEKRGTNGVHPALIGYYQIADAVYRNFISRFCQ